jgi:hypothetical protein
MVCKVLRPGARPCAGQAGVLLRVGSFLSSGTRLPLAPGGHTGRWPIRPRPANPEPSGLVSHEGAERVRRGQGHAAEKVMTRCSTRSGGACLCKGPGWRSPGPRDETVGQDDEALLHRCNLVVGEILGQPHALERLMRAAHSGVVYLPWPVCVTGRRGQLVIMMAMDLRPQPRAEARTSLLVRWPSLSVVKCSSGSRSGYVSRPDGG